MKTNRTLHNQFLSLPVVNKGVSIQLLRHLYFWDKPKSVIRYDSNRLLHNNTILHSVIFLMTVIRKMIIRKYPIDGLKGQKQIAYGNAVGLGNIRYRPEGAKAQSLLMLLPFQGDRSASHLPKAMPWAIISLPRWGVSLNCG
ncbi:MAG: hypothetical protein IKG88_03420 [Bacteroidales bacterium]|nr:hypothetical protein [Bacteroidales bacterium]